MSGAKNSGAGTGTVEFGEACSRRVTAQQSRVSLPSERPKVLRNVCETTVIAEHGHDSGGALHRGKESEMTPREIANYLIANRRALRSRKSRRCPVCGHFDQHCVVMDDGSAALCPKSDGAGAVKRYGAYGSLYLLASGQTMATLPPVKTQPAKELTDAELHAKWAPRARHWWQGHGAEVGRLALVLGVAAWSLDELKCGWDGRAWVFPERNGEGLIVGVSRRFEDGTKRCATGSRRGLTYSDEWASNPGPALLVEGGSDVAAGITLGLAVIGRPSNVGGIDMLRVLLNGNDKHVVVVGERDKKPDGRWPGMEGAKSVAMGLQKRLKRAVGCRLLPGAKDLRAWLNAQSLDVANREVCFAAGMELVKGW